MNENLYLKPEVILLNEWREFHSIFRIFSNFHVCLNSQYPFQSTHKNKINQRDRLLPYSLKEKREFYELIRHRKD